MGDRLKILSAVFMSFLLVVTYQNCGSGDFNVPSSTKKSSTSSGGNTNGGGDATAPVITNFVLVPALNANGKIDKSTSYSFSPTFEKAVAFDGGNYVWQYACGANAPQNSQAAKLTVPACAADKLTVKLTVYNGLYSGTKSMDYVVDGGNGVYITDISPDKTAGDPTKLPWGQVVSFTAVPYLSTETYSWTANCGSQTFSSNVIDTSKCSLGNSLSVNVSIVGKGVSFAKSYSLTNNEVAPSIAQQPANVTVDLGSALEGSVLANGSNLVFSWFAKKVGESSFSALSSSFVQAPVSQAGSMLSKFSIPSVDASWNGSLFYVVVSNSLSTVTSNQMTATVNSTLIPRITSDLSSSYSAAVGGSVTFTIVADGNSSIKPFTYQWLNCSNNVAYTNGPNAATWTLSGLTLSQDQMRVKAKVIGTNGQAAFGACATLTVNALPTITAQPTKLSIAPGGTATFNVTASGATGYKWQRNGVALSDGVGSLGETVAGATTASLKITNVPAAYNGYSFNVLVSNSAGTTPSDAVVLSVFDSCSETARVACEDNCDYNVYESCTLVTNSTTGACSCLRKKPINPCGSSSDYTVQQQMNPCGM